MDQAKASKEAKDFKFLLSLVKTGTLTMNYDEAATSLGMAKLAVRQKLCAFRKTYDYPIVKDGPKDGESSTPKKARAAKRAATPGDDDDMEVKKPAAKRGRKPKAQQIIIHEDTEDSVQVGTSVGAKFPHEDDDADEENNEEHA